jgi:hypothetical protein
MNRPLPLSFLIIALLGLFLTGMAHAKPIDSLEDVLKSAPPSALRKLLDKPTDAKSLAEINQAFGSKVAGQKAVIEAEIDLAEYTPGGRNAFRARAVNVPVKWKEHTLEQLNHFYFPDATKPAEGTVKVGSKVKISGVVGKCELVNNGGKLQIIFDVGESKLQP